MYKLNAIRFVARVSLLEVMRKIVAALVFGGLVLRCGDAFSGEKEEYSPVEFAEGKKSFQKRIKFPEWEGDVLAAVRCDGFVDVFGVMGDTYCFSDIDKYEEFEAAVIDAAVRAKLKPALVNGKKQGVWFQFRVVFIQDGERRIVVVYPNYGLNHEKYGAFYRSPQRYGLAPRAFNRCVKRNTKVWVKADVDEHGKISNVEALDGNVSGRCVKRIVKNLKKSKFIPAEHNGVAVPAVYVEAFFFTSAAEVI